MEKAGDAELIARMKSSIQKLGSSAQGYGDATLMRFLVVKSRGPEKAAKMLVEWQKWRAEFVPLGFVPDSEVAGQLGQRKVYLGGPTKDGHPLLMIKGCNHTPPVDQLQLKSNILIFLQTQKCNGRFLELLIITLVGESKGTSESYLIQREFLVHLMDKTIARGTELGNDKMVGVLDLKQFSYKNVDVRGFISGFQCLQAYFPDRVERLYIIHMPRLFVSGWRIISRFIDKAIHQKMKIVRSEEEMKSFIEQIGEEALPECYGGKAELVALQDVVLESD